MALRVFRIPFSTNVERVALAAGHKGLDVDWIDVDEADRSPVVAASGQELVPVLLDGDETIVDSTAIIEHLERRFPEPPLFPADEARRAEVGFFVDWFNRVWKRPPNLIYDELQKSAPDRARIDAWGAEMAGWLPWFEAMLAGRDYLMGPEFSAADVCAFPFLRYALTCEDDDTHLFHDILVEHMPLKGGFPKLAAWIRRVDTRPRV
jgi:glutathione S-transferase